MKMKLMLLGTAVFLCSCAGINVKQPEIGSVKKIAILSVTGNEEIKDIKVEKGEKETLLKSIGNAIKDNIDYFTEEQVTIVTHGANELFKTFNEMNGWTVVPFETVTESPEVEAFFLDNKIEGESINVGAVKLKEKQDVRRVAPNGMRVLPYNKINPQGMTWVNGERVEAPILRGIGKLCETLGVDAIAVAEFYFAYETGMMTKVTSNVTPIVAVNVVLVDKNGNKILYTDYGWKTFESDDAAKINRDYVNLKDDRSIKAFKRGVDIAVAGFKEKAAKKLGK
jgi:hypothetical protein